MGGFDTSGDPARKRPETHDLLVGGAQEGVEGDLLEALDAVLEGDLPVLLEEEPRVGQAGADHLLVSPPDDRRIAGEGIVDRQKVGQEVAFAIHDRKILLMGDHRGDEDLAGKFEVLGVEVPADDRRVFGEEGDLFEEFLVPERLAPDRGRRLLGFIKDDLFPFRGIDDDEMGPHQV